MNWNTVEEHFPADEIARAKDIFEHHCRVMSDSPNRPRGWRWLPGIADLICKRLQNFSPEDIKQAALNLSKSDWHRGRRGGREYCDPGFLYRSDEQVDKWFNQGTVSSKGDHLKTDNEYDGIGDVGHVE